MNYASIKPIDIANGEGVRVSLFVSGCNHHCKNCFNSEAWDFKFGQPFTLQIQEQLLDYVAPNYIKGLSLLGGEPLEPENQPTVLNLLKTFKQRFPNKTVWCYTGFVYDKELLGASRAKTNIIKEILSYIDVLVDGRFVEELKDITLRFRGSSNQRIIDVAQSLNQNKVVLYNLK